MTKADDTLEISYILIPKSISKRKISSLPFLDIKNYILGKNYELSLVFADKKTVTILNKKYRNMEYTPNILSFPYSKTTGEIFIHLETARKQAPDFEMDMPTYITFLFIHGCLHLNDHQHSSTMEEEERKILKKFTQNNLNKKNVRKN